MFSCSTELSMKFQPLMKTKMLKNIYFLAFKLSNTAFILLINVKMPIIVGILTFMSMMNFILFSHCIAIGYAMSPSLVKLTEIGTRWGCG